MSGMKPSAMVKADAGEVMCLQCLGAPGADSGGGLRGGKDGRQGNSGGGAGVTTCMTQRPLWTRLLNIFDPVD